MKEELIMMMIGKLPFSLPMINLETKPTRPMTPWLAILNIRFGFSKTK